MITQMGARLHTSFDGSATHFIHKGKATSDAKRDLLAARRSGLHVVSPTWLYKCMEARLKVNEADYREEYDNKHTTLNTTIPYIPRERPTLSVIPKRGSSPPSRPTTRAGSTNRGKGQVLGFSRSATVGFQPHRSAAGHPSPTQTFQGTAAGVTSAMFAGDHVSSSMNTEAVNSTMDMSYADMNTLNYDSGVHSDNDGVWQPLPAIPVVRSTGRKRRRPPAEPRPETNEMDNSLVCEVSAHCREPQLLLAELFLC